MGNMTLTIVFEMLFARSLIERRKQETMKCSPTRIQQKV
jgi:hypothetical protein